MGIDGKTMRKSCKNCMKQDYCKQKGILCVNHKSLEDKISNLHMTFEEYKAFCMEWDEARKAVRKKLGCAAGQSRR